jgi:hypothetical protein
VTEDAFGEESPTAPMFLASEKIAAQLGCGIDEAFQRILIRARATAIDAEYIALDIIDGVIRFDRE